MAQGRRPWVAIVGAGLMGRWHAHFASKAGATLSAVVDPDARAAALLGSKLPNARPYPDLGRCLRELEIDVVHVCTPADSHYSLAKTALEAGSHVLVEKPATRSATEARELVDLAQRKGLKLNPIHQYPFQRGFQKLLRAKDRLGELVHVRFTLCSAGGRGLPGERTRDLLLEIFPHPFSVLYALFGNDLDPSSWRVATFTQEEMEVHGTVNDTSLDISVSLRGRPIRNALAVVGTRGSGHADFFHGYCVIEDGEVSRKAKLLRPLTYGSTLLVAASANLIARGVQREWAYPGLSELIRRFYRAVAEDGPAPITDDELIRAASLVDRLRPDRSVPPRSPRVSLRRQIGVGGCSISPRAKELVMEVLNSNRLSAGPMTERFERQIAELHGCQYGLMCNSGTSALQISLAALKEVNGWQDGDEVLVPAVTFIATSNAVLYNHLRPVFVDVEPEYYCMDPRRIEEHLSARTRAIVPVHVGGAPCDMAAIGEFARASHLRVVEDAAEAMFVRYKGRPVGSFGDVACFSTYVAHIVSTGVGGLCATNDPGLWAILKSLMNHGRDPRYTRIEDDQGVEGGRLLDIVDRRFSFVRLGHSFRCTEMEAALGLAQLEARETLWARRQQVAARLTEGLTPLQEHLQLPKPRPEADHAYMFYPITVVNPRISRADVIQYLENHAIETRYLLPLINQPVYREIFGNQDARCPVAARLNRTAFYIGCHPEMTDDDVAYVLDCFQRYFKDRA